MGSTAQALHHRSNVGHLLFNPFGEAKLNKGSLKIVLRMVRPEVDVAFKVVGQKRRPSSRGISRMQSGM